MVTIIWNKNGLHLHLLDVYERHNETWFSVCKVGADPIMGRFRVRAADTSAIDYLVLA